MKLHLGTNIAEGTPEELVEYLRLVEEGDNTKLPLFSFGHVHQPDEDTLKSLVGSLVKVADSYTGSTEAEEESSVYDEGAFYVTTSESSKSFLPVGVILKHQHGRKFEDSTGVQYIISTTSYVKRVDSGGDVTRKDRFELAKHLGIQLTSTTDFAIESSNRKFKVKESGTDFDVGVIVTIAKDDGDNLPQCKDKYSNFSYVYLRNLELVEEEETASTDLKVGDKVKVLFSACGAEGEATVTAVFEGGRVELAGTSKFGTYLTNWTSNVMYLEKIEEEEDLEPEEADEILGYRYWYLEGTTFNKFVVLEASIDGYFRDSRGFRYTHKYVSKRIKPIDRENASKYFERSKDRGYLLKYYPTADVFTD